MARTSKIGEKFAPKYGVKTLQIYQGDPGPEALRIPPPGHFLHDPSSPNTFDEKKVQQIDEDGHCSNVIEVWTDIDNDQLYVVDGRETLQNIREVNRRRSKEDRAPVDLRLAPLKLKEKELIAHLSVKNFHRRLPGPSVYGLNIYTQRKAGWSWEKIVQFLHVESEDAEQWCKKRLPLAFAEPEVRAAFDSGKIPLTQAHKFGGRAVDGSEAKGRKVQLDMLAIWREEKETAPSAPKQLSPKKRDKVYTMLTNGIRETLSAENRKVAKAVAATLSFAAGDSKALDEWPEIAAAVAAALADKGEKKGKSKETK